MKTLHLRPYLMYIKDDNAPATVRTMFNHTNMTLEWQRKFIVNGQVKWVIFRVVTWEYHSRRAKGRPHSRRDT